MEDIKKCDAVVKKRTRKSHTRKSTLSCFINMTEARREIANALQIHRSASVSDCRTNNNNPHVISSEQKYCHRLINSMPAPEPTWSTTAPAVFCVHVPPVEVVEFERLDDVSSSYSWWTSFLNSLDGKNGDASNMLSGDSEHLGQALDGENAGKSMLPEGNDQNPFVVEEWLIFPATEDPAGKEEYIID